MLKSIVLIVSVMFFAGCGSLVYDYNHDEKEFVFNFKDGSHYAVRLQEPKHVGTFNQCTMNSYTLNDHNDVYGKLFIEHISLSPDCTWNGLSTSFFISLFKDTLKLKSVKTIETIDIDNYSFTTYKINDEFYMNFILAFDTMSSTLILDYEGELSADILKRLKPSYRNKYLERLRFSSEYNESLVLKNPIYGYFGKQRESFK